MCSWSSEYGGGRWTRLLVCCGRRGSTSTTYPVKVTNFLAYVASGSVGGAALVTTCVKAGATAGAGPGGFPQCLYVNGVPRGFSYLCSSLICSFLGTTCADGLVQREVFLLNLGEWTRSATVSLLRSQRHVCTNRVVCHAVNGPPPKLVPLERPRQP